MLVRTALTKMVCLVRPILVMNVFNFLSCQDFRWVWKVFVQLFLLSSSESLRLARRQHTVRAQRDFDMYKYFSWFILHQFLCTGVFEFVCIYNLFMYFAISSIKSAIRVGKRC